MDLTDIIMYISDMRDWKPGGRIRINSCDIFAFEPDWSWSVRQLPDLDLWYLTEGSGWIHGGETRTTIGGGDCLLMRPGCSYEAWHDPAAPLTLYAFHFDLLGSDGRRVPMPPEDLPPFIRKMDAGAFFRELLKRSIRAYKDGRRQWAEVWFEAAFMEVLRQDANTWPPGPLGDQARRIEAICERIRSHPGRPVRVEDMAAELHVSPEHFSRIFRRLQGVSPRGFITRTRMEAAQSLLLTSRHPVSRIAELLGYESPFYFSRLFKAKVGVSPSVFRSSAEQDPGPEDE